LPHIFPKFAFAHYVPLLDLIENSIFGIGPFNGGFLKFNIVSFNVIGEEMLGFHHVEMSSEIEDKALVGDI